MSVEDPVPLECVVLRQVSQVLHADGLRVEDPIALNVLMLRHCDVHRHPPPRPQTMSPASSTVATPVLLECVALRQVRVEDPVPLECVVLRQVLDADRVRVEDPIALECVVLREGGDVRPEDPVPLECVVLRQVSDLECVVLRPGCSCHWALVMR